MTVARPATAAEKEASMYIGLGTVLFIIVVILLFRMFSGRRT